MPRRSRPPALPPRRKPGTGTVSVRANGRTFVVLPADLDPKRRPHYGPGRRQAFALREDAERWLDAEISRRRNPSSHTTTRREPLRVYLARWYAMNAPEWPRRTATAYRTHLRRWSMLGDIAVEDLTREHVQTAVSGLLTMTWQRHRGDGTPTGEPRRYAPRTVSHARMLLHQALDDLVPEILPSNPARLRRRPRRVIEPDAPVWTQEQSDKLLTVAATYEPHLELAFRLILRRALRIGEVIALCASDIDDARSVLVVDESADERGEASGPTKTRRTRDIPLSADLRARITAYRRAYPSTRPFLFLVDGRRVSFRLFREAWARCIRVGQLPLITPKDGRATCATLLLDAGHPLPQVSALLGHTSIATTAKFYARILKRRTDQVAEIGEALDAALSPKSGPESGVKVSG